MMVRLNGELGKLARVLVVSLALAVVFKAQAVRAQDPEQAPPTGESGESDAPFSPSEWEPSLEVLTIQQAHAVMQETQWSLRINEQNLIRAESILDEAVATILPSFGIEAVYTFNDQEVEFAFPSPLAPLSPYLDSVFDGDPALQQFFDENPGVIDARALAAAEPEPSIVQFQHDYFLSATLSQTLFDARVFPFLRQARIGLLRAELSQEQIAYELRGALIELYFNAVRFSRFIDVAGRNLDLARISLSRAETAVELDVGNQFEVNRASVAVFSAERDVENARLAYALAIDALATFLDVPADFDVRQPAEIAVPNVLDHDVPALLSERAEARGLDLGIEFQEERVQLLRNSWWPTFGAQAQAFYRREAAFSGDSFSWSITAFMNWQIWDGGLRLAQMDGLEADLAEAHILLEQAHASNESEIRQSVSQIESSQRVIAAAEAEVALAETNYELTEEARLLGVAVAVDVELAQQQLFLSQLALVDAQIQQQQQIYLLMWLLDQPL